VELFRVDNLRGIYKEGRRFLMEIKSVKVFALSSCPHCKSIKRLLRDAGIKFEYTELDLLAGEQRRVAMKELLKFNPRCSFPTTVIGEKVILGGEEDEIRAALGL
jgi:glutaredoxin